MQQQQTRRNRRRRALRRNRILGLLGLILLLSAAAVLLVSCLGGEGKRPEDGTGRNTVPAEPSDPGAAQDTALPSSYDPRELRQSVTMPDSALSQGNLVLVNKDHGFDASLPKTVSVYERKNGSYLVKDIYLSVTAETVEALNAWMEAFAAETGVRDVNVVSGWRSLADQTAIYDNAVAEKGQAHADAYIALPGRSEHHTGLAVDLDTYDVENGTSGGFDGAGAYAWAVQHAWEYGFIQRYPPSKSSVTGIDFESWHFRYVGLPHAFIMAEEDLCLEEYIDFLRGYPFSGEHLFVTCREVRYEIWFCPKDEVVLPTCGSFSVSGNNVDGYIVTVVR